MTFNKYKLWNIISKNIFQLHSVERVSNSCIEYNYSIQGYWKRLFNSDKLRIDFGIDVLQIPDSVLAIPLLGNILPISWICDATIKLDYLDQNFFSCIDLVKKGYHNMYPNLEFLGKIEVKELESNCPETNSYTSAMFFSAGVDSFSTFLNHKNESPLLITLCGSDIPLDDKKGWAAMQERQRFMEKTYGCKSISIFSNFRTILNEGRLCKLVSSSGDKWWHGFQHGLAIICHAAPLSYKFGINNLYIASSFTSSLYKYVTCASAPSIDNNVQFVRTHTQHDDATRDRYDKVKHISDYHKKTGIVFPLHVCWTAAGGGNCSRCEKCTRTILALYACNEDPTLFGFNPELTSEQNVRSSCRTWQAYENSYKKTIEILNENYNHQSIAKWAKWALDFHIDRP